MYHYCQKIRDTWCDVTLAWDKSRAAFHVFQLLLLCYVTCFVCSQNLRFWEKQLCKSWCLCHVLPQTNWIRVHESTKFNSDSSLFQFEAWIIWTCSVFSVFFRSSVQQNSLIYGQSWFSFMINMRSMTTLCSPWCLIRQTRGKKACLKTLLQR